MSNTLLAALMQLKGIDDSFIDATGQAVTVSDHNIKRIIQAMGVDASSESTLTSHYEAQESKHWLSLLPPVAVFQQSASYELEVRLPIDFVTDNLVYRITTETGENIEQHLTATDFPLLAVNEITDVEFQMYAVVLSATLAQGYHHLALLEEGNEEPLAIMTLIITPETCYQSPSLIQQKRVAVMTLATQQTLDDSIQYLGTNAIKSDINKAAQQGFQALHLKTAETSLPALWETILQLDLSILKEYDPVLPHFTVNNAADEYALFIDKLSLLRDAFSALPASTSSFTTFIEAGGERLKKQTNFAAVQYHCVNAGGELELNKDWPVAFQAYQNQALQDWLAENQEEVQFWYFCYWLIAQQGVLLEEYAKLQGIHLGFHQYAVIGGIKQGMSSWTEAEYYGKNVSVSQPELRETESSQRVETLPFIPDVLFQVAYQPYIDLLRGCMQNKGILHFQRSSELLRCWWAINGEDAKQGAFVFYNVYDMLNILALESVRQQCVIVADDIDAIEGLDALLTDAHVYNAKGLSF